MMYLTACVCAESYWLGWGTGKTSQGKEWSKGRSKLVPPQASSSQGGSTRIWEGGSRAGGCQKDSESLPEERPVGSGSGQRRGKEKENSEGKGKSNLGSSSSVVY